MHIDPNTAIANKVVHVIRESLFMPNVPIERHTRLVEDLDVDSIDLMEALIDLETDFGVEFPPDATLRFRTVGNLVAFLRSRIQPVAA
ncbi:Acyl carrier protein [Rhodovastum atsumiense]|uniref:Acyl carrier protein n=1 Tax=Rhodovastum atsumiense TaxID=504468 RepID=A0A5M6J174_9PROT|nr:acyl carrier protein [Rhodovastum atsumiense]KAA5614340.1 acyl carrier protein [Rhodovastum atsumiense]CAH2604809.1 Acyl carrier protein [Rhodovastum atsumiense]